MHDGFSWCCNGEPLLVTWFTPPGGGVYLTALTVLTRLTVLTADRIDQVDVVGGEGQ
jgi:hypothetical protein